MYVFKNGRWLVCIRVSLVGSGRLACHTPFNFSAHRPASPPLLTYSIQYPGTQYKRVYIFIQTTLIAHSHV